MADTLTPEQQAAADAKAVADAAKAQEEADAKAAKEAEADAKKLEELRAQVAKLEAKVEPQKTKSGTLTVQPLPKDSGATAWIYKGIQYTAGQGLKDLSSELVKELREAKILPAE